MWLFLIVALLMGILVPVQTAANARMRMSVGSAFVVTLISFFVSACALLTISVFCGIPIMPTASQFSGIPLWGWTGGIIALLTITVTIYLFKALGQLQTAILPLLGQLVFSLLIDHFGLFDSLRIPLTCVRIFGMVLVVTGVVFVIVLPNLKFRTPSTNNRGKLLWQITGIVAGCLMASIGAIYGTLGLRLGSAVQASTVSFLIAVCVMAAFCAANGSIRSARHAFDRGNPWWMWLGGICGAIAVFGNSWLIPKIGAGVFFTAFLIGQMILSLCMEKFGWMGAMKKPITAIQIVGIVLMLVGVALIRM